MQVVSGIPTVGQTTVKSFGATGLGVLDETAAIQAAINATPVGGECIVPDGNYVISSNITIPSGVALVGATYGPFDPNTIPSGSTYIGPCFLIPNTSVTPVQFTGRSAVLSDIAFYYPNQVAPTAATPTVYPATITTVSGSAGNVIRRCTLINAYVGISLAGGRHRVEDCTLGCFSQDIIVDHSLDVVRLSQIQCSPLWDTVNGLAVPQTIDTWVLANKTCLTVLRADGMVIEDFFAFRGNIGMNIIDGTDSPAQSYGLATNVRFDTFALGVRAVSTQSPGWQFDNLAVGASTAPITMPVGGAATPQVRVRGGAFWGAAKVPSNAVAGLLDINGVNGLNPAGAGSLAGGQPAVPATTVAKTNVTGVDCTVQVIGGTVTQIAVGGINTGLTSGFFRVPANQTITLTYSVAPTWEWWGD